MQFESLTLYCDDPAAQQVFYMQTLGLRVENGSREVCRIALPHGELIFARDPLRRRNRYHFAFNIPHNQFDDAARWLAERTPLARDAASVDRFRSDTWDADICYFYDAAGNIGELIARHTLPGSARDAPFAATSVLSVSELGVAVDDTACGATDWFPDTGIAAEPLPFEARIRRDDGSAVLLRHP